MELRWGEGRRRALARRGGIVGITTLSERTITFQTTNRSAREIRFNDKFLLK